MINPVIPDSVARPDASRFTGWQQFMLILRVLRYARLVWDKVLLRLIITQVNASVATVPAVLGIRIIDEAFVQKDMGLFIQFCLIVTAAIVVTKVLDFTNDVMAIYGIGRIGLQLRTDIIEHILHLPPKFYESRPVGEHMYRSVYDTSDVQFVVNDTLPRAVMNFQKVLMLGIVLATIKLWLIPVCAVYLVLFFIVKHLISSQLRIVLRRERRGAQRVDALTRELFTAFKLVKGYNLEPMANRWYWAQVSEYLRQVFRRLVWLAIDMVVGNPAQGIGFPALIFVLNLVAGRMLISGGGSSLTVGEYTAIAIVVTQMALPIQDAIALFQETRQRLVPVERLMDTMEVQSDVVDAPDALVLSSPKGHIEVRNVTFSYDEMPVLRNVSLEAKPGEKIAIVGPIGAGKSTLLRLLLRLADPQEGEILVDGVDIRKIAQDSLRRAYGTVPQGAILFSETLEDNIRRAVPSAPRELVEDAARMARVDEFAHELPEGYDTQLEAGTNLSGGQRQRVCMARALIKNAPMLLLDEATSALDPVSEQQVVTAVDDRYAGRTRVVVAHNLLNARTADRVYVFDGGEVVESGTHEELISRGGKYCELWEAEL